MSGQKRPRTMGSYSSKKDYTERLKEAGEIHSKTPEQIKHDQEIDNVFKDIEEEKEIDNRGIVEKFFDSLRDKD